MVVLKPGWLCGRNPGLLTQGFVVRAPSSAVFIHSQEFSLDGTSLQGVWYSHTTSYIGHSLFTAQISSDHWVVIRDEILMLCVIACSAVVSYWVRNTLHSPMMIFRFPQYLPSPYYRTPSQRWIATSCAQMPLSWSLLPRTYVPVYNLPQIGSVMQELNWVVSSVVAIITLIHQIILGWSSDDSQSEVWPTTPNCTAWPQLSLLLNVTMQSQCACPWLWVGE